jgi:hypothetical protein
MVEGHRHAHAVLLAVAEHLPEEEGVVEDVVVREGGAFGGPRGSGRVLDVDRVVELELLLAGLDVRLRSPRSAGAQRVPLLLQHHRHLKLGAIAAHQSQEVHVVAVLEGAGQDQEAHPGLAEGVAELRRLVGGVDVDQDGSDSGRRVLGDHPLVAVRRPDADAIAGLYSRGEERASQDGRLVPELPVGGPVALGPHHDSVTIREALDRSPEVLPDGFAEHRHRAGTMGVGQHGAPRKSRGARPAVFGSVARPPPAPRPARPAVSGAIAASAW